MAGAMYEKLCSMETLERAFRKAGRRKTTKKCVLDFEKDLDANLAQLCSELLMRVYKPLPLETFIIRNPKTRKINRSDFRDRIVHHAICNIIEPIFDKAFINDSYANRHGYLIRSGRGYA